MLSVLPRTYWCRSISLGLGKPLTSMILPWLKASAGNWGRQRKVLRIIPVVFLFLHRYLKWNRPWNVFQYVFQKVSNVLEFPAQRRQLPFLNTSVKLILDNKRLTTGYFTLFSKGKAAEVDILCWSSLYKDAKGNLLKRKQKWNWGQGLLWLCRQTDWWMAVKVETLLLCGGTYGAGVDLEIKTANEPLVIDDIYGTFTAYPMWTLPFQCTRTWRPSKMLEVGWRTARLCLRMKTYMDCPYYEQLQYFGDARIQQMITMYNPERHDYGEELPGAWPSGRWSLTESRRVVSNQHASIYFFCMLFLDREWLRLLDVSWRCELSGRRLLQFRFRVISWYESIRNRITGPAYIPNWSLLVDWSKGFSGGQPVRESDGRSNIRIWYSSIHSIRLLRWKRPWLCSFGRSLSRTIEKIRQNIRPRYWDEQRDCLPIRIV